MMRRGLGHTTIWGWIKDGNDESQNDAKTILDVVAGARAAGLAAAASRVSISPAGAGERRGERAEKERFDYDGQTVLP